MEYWPTPTSLEDTAAVAALKGQKLNVVRPLVLTGSISTGQQSCKLDSTACHPLLRKRNTSLCVSRELLQAGENLRGPRLVEGYMQARLTDSWHQAVAFLLASAQDMKHRQDARQELVKRQQLVQFNTGVEADKERLVRKKLLEDRVLQNYA